jgi:DNA repair protein REV1
LNLTPSKRIAFKEYKVVTPAWIMDSIRLRKVQDWRNYREDQVLARSSDMGVAPDGTQIAQPRLAFAKPAVVRGIGASSSFDSIDAPPPGAPKAASPEKVGPSSRSPRRLPPPTSDPISVLHVEGAQQAAAGPSGPQPPWVAQGWYNTKSNERSANLLKDEAWRLNETAVNTTEFLDKYYRESRLHWLSTWKAELKKMVNDLSEGREIDISDTLDKRRRKPLKGTEADGRVILHVDFDSFFVAVSLLARPHLKGVPVVVCHAGQGDVNSSSEIASASYEAREFGIKNGMR